MYYKDCPNLSKLMIENNFCVCNGYILSIHIYIYILSYIEYFVSYLKDFYLCKFKFYLLNQ